MKGNKAFVAVCVAGVGVLGSAATAGAVPSSTNCAQTLKLETIGKLDSGSDTRDEWKLGDAISDGFYGNEPHIDGIPVEENVGPEEVSSSYKAGNVSGAPTPGPTTDGGGFETWGSVRRVTNGGSCT